MRDEYQGAFWAENHALWSESASAAWHWVTDLSGRLVTVLGVAQPPKQVCEHKEG